MPNAAIQELTLNPTWDMATLRNSLKTMLTTHCGFTLVEEYGTSPINVVVSFDTVDSGSTNKQVFLRFDTTTSVSSLRCEMFGSWNTSSRPADNSGTGSEAISSNMAFNSSLVMMGLNHPEQRGVVLVNGTSSTVIGFVGYWKPANKIADWPADKLFAFISNSYHTSGHAFRGLHGSASPFNQSVSTFYPVSRDANMLNPISEFGNKRSATPGTIKVLIPGAKGVCGLFSTDLAEISGNSLVPALDDAYNTSLPPGWEVVAPGYGVGAAWVIKTGA